MKFTWKKLVILLLAALCLLLCACNKKEEVSPTPTPELTPTPSPEIPGLREYNKGLSYYDADGVERDFEKALEYFLESANKEYVPAMEKLGYMHEMGLGTAANPETAGLWFSVAAQKGSAIAKMYIDGVGHLDEDAVHSLLPADAVEQYVLGMECFYGIGAKQDFAAACKYFKNSAELGCGRGCYGLAVCYLRGKGTEQDFEKAAEYFERALELGCVDAADKLIYLYSGEYGAEPDAELEQKWRQRRFEILTISAERGYIDYALEASETALDDGFEDLAQEWYAKYFEEYELACEEGDSEAQFAMAVYYMTRGRIKLPEPVVEEAPEEEAETDEVEFEAAPETELNPDLEKARELLTLSSQQGNIYAEHLLWCENLEDEDYLNGLISGFVEDEPYYVYSVNMHYWLCYKNSDGDVKLRIVYIPACGSGETTEVIDRFSNESLYELRLFRRQYVDDLVDCVTAKRAPMADAELIGFYPIASTLSMYEAAGVSELFAVSQQSGEYSQFMYGNHPKPGSLISLGELGRMYLELLPENYR